MNAHPVRQATQRKPEHKLEMTVHLWQPKDCPREQFEFAARAAVHDAVKLLFAHLAGLKQPVSRGHTLQRDASGQRPCDVLQDIGDALAAEQIVEQRGPTEGRR